ncbi:MAG: MFS transporter [Erysipelotrichaceae bacterium]|nr:MFS transporter [Erysipelotrichaceae bacterium]
MKLFKNLTEEENAWVLYDVGNSAFTMLSCSLIPIWFKSLAIGNNPGQVTSDQATGIWSLVVAIVTVLLALIGPVCGAIADHKDTKKIFFTTCVALGVIGCVICGFATSWIPFMIIFILAKLFYQASLTFYDSMLNDVTTDDRADEVSSYGYAWGYIGSCIPFLLALAAYIFSGGLPGFALFPEYVGKIIGCSVTAIWWLIVTLPLIKSYRQINYVEGKGQIKAAFIQIGHSFKRIATQDKKVLFFLIAFFLYIDGVGTIIDNCINIGTDLGLDTVGQVVFLLATQVVAWIGSLVFAKLSRKHDTVPLILVCICGYFVVCVYALFIKTIWDFGIMAFMVGCFQGSIQSLSRSYYSKIIPDEHSGEYFGIYDIFSKGASFLGSAVIAIVKFAGGTINLAVGLLAIFFALGFIFLKIADKCPQSEESKKDIVA